MSAGAELTRLVIELADRAGDRLLRLDPDAAARISRLDGKVARVEVAGFHVFLRGEDGTLRVLADVDGEPDVRLRGGPAGFVQVLRDPDVARFSDGTLEIEGDAELARDFARVLTDFDPDLEEHLSHLVGDLGARKAGNLARDLRDWLRQASRTAAGDVGEYLQEEARILAPTTRVERFIEDVDRLRADVERLEQRVRRIASDTP